MRCLPHDRKRALPQLLPDAVLVMEIIVLTQRIYSVPQHPIILENKKQNKTKRQTAELAQT
jgi:hypothetical protein